MLLYRFLSRAGVEPHLILGVANSAGAITGHAWIVVEGAPVLEPEESLFNLVPVLEFGPGGVADVTARIVADKLSQKLGEQVVIENMPGPGGINAARTVVRAPADGYTLGLVSNGTAISVDMFEHLPFDPVKQFAMVSEIGSFDLVVAVSGQSKYKTLQDLIAAAKANPGRMSLLVMRPGIASNH